MELRQLATFIRVAQFKSFSRAAESLGYSQSAVTVQIRQLEEELDTRLFDRMGKRIALTDTGERFLSHACDVMNQVNQARMSVTSTACLLYTSSTAGSSRFLYRGFPFRSATYSRTFSFPSSLNER